MSNCVRSCARAQRSSCRPGTLRRCSDPSSVRLAMTERPYPVLRITGCNCTLHHVEFGALGRPCRMSAEWPLGRASGRHCVTAIAGPQVARQQRTPIRPGRARTRRRRSGLEPAPRISALPPKPMKDAFGSAQPQRGHEHSCVAERQHTDGQDAGDHTAPFASSLDSRIRPPRFLRVGARAVHRGDSCCRLAGCNMITVRRHRPE